MNIILFTFVFANINKKLYVCTRFVLININSKILNQ